jgi:hypothetical protein
MSVKPRDEHDLATRVALSESLNSGLRHSHWWRRRLLDVLRARLPSAVAKKVTDIQENVADNCYRVGFSNGHFIEIPAGQLHSEAFVARVCLECP